MLSSGVTTRESPQAGEPWEPRIVAFVCNWCSYVGADLAGTSRMGYPANVRIIRVPCSGRIDPVFIVRSFQRGADGVLVSGCHPGDCHYNKGNYYARRRMLMLKGLLEFTGLETSRVQMSWVSASEGAKWAKVITEMTEEIRRLGPTRHATAPQAQQRAAGGTASTGGNGSGDGRGSVASLPRMRFDTACEHGGRVEERHPLGEQDKGG